MSWKNVENYLLGFLVIITSELQRGEAKDKRTDAFSRPLCYTLKFVAYNEKAKTWTKTFFFYATF